MQSHLTYISFHFVGKNTANFWINKIILKKKCEIRRNISVLVDIRKVLYVIFVLRSWSKVLFPKKLFTFLTSFIYLYIETIDQVHQTPTTEILVDKRKVHEEIGENNTLTKGFIV